MMKAKTKCALAKELGISRSSLYYKPKKSVTDEELKQKIIAVMAEHSAYGHRRVAWALNINKKAVKRIMSLNGLKPSIRRRWRPTRPEDINRPETRVENVLKAICPIRSNIIWAGDFTYMWFKDRFWYLATVIDIHTREIVGWHIANHHTTSLIMDALSDAKRRTKTSPMYFHSDQGSEYVSGAYESLLEEYDIIASHSRKSSPWQNGYQESFYSQFKLELGNPNRFNHIGELIEAIHGQIAYYNNKRIHSAHRMPPAMFKEKQQLKYAAYAALTA